MARISPQHARFQAFRAMSEYAYVDYGADEKEHDLSRLSADRYGWTLVNPRNPLPGREAAFVQSINQLGLREQADQAGFGFSLFRNSLNQYCIAFTGTERRVTASVANTIPLATNELTRQETISNILGRVAAATLGVTYATGHSAGFPCAAFYTASNGGHAVGIDGPGVLTELKRFAEEKYGFVNPDIFANPNNYFTNFIGKTYVSATDMRPLAGALALANPFLAWQLNNVYTNDHTGNVVNVGLRYWQHPVVNYANVRDNLESYFPLGKITSGDNAPLSVATKSDVLNDTSAWKANAYTTGVIVESEGNTFYTVVKGDTISVIEKTYGLTRAQLYELNPWLQDRTSADGQHILIRPDEQVRLSASPEASTFTFVTSETKARIDEMFGVSDGEPGRNVVLRQDYEAYQRNAAMGTWLFAGSPGLSGLGNLFGDSFADYRAMQADFTPFNYTLPSSADAGALFGPPAPAPSWYSNSTTRTVQDAISDLHLSKIPADSSQALAA